MANDQDNQKPTTGTESDISKSQSAQQPAQAQQDEKKSGEPGQFETGQAPEQTDKAAEGQQDTLAQERTDVEGSSLGSERGEAASGFVGSEGKTDTSSELVEDEDAEKDDQRGDGE